jgi:NADH-quinone oxidoreductase subunit G
MEGRVQSFYATVPPPGEARPGWKVLRVLGTMLGVPGFEYDSVEQVRNDCLKGREVSSLLSNRTRVEIGRGEQAAGIQRIADVPIYFSDPLVRRSRPLQDTADARPPSARMNARLMQRLGVADGQKVVVTQGSGAATLAAVRDDGVPDECVRISAAHPSTATLGPMFGTVTVEKASMEEAA